MYADTYIYFNFQPEFPISIRYQSKLIWYTNFVLFLLTIDPSSLHQKFYIDRTLVFIAGISL